MFIFQILNYLGKYLFVLSAYSLTGYKRLLVISSERVSYTRELHDFSFLFGISREQVFARTHVLLTGDNPYIFAHFHRDTIHFYPDERIFSDPERVQF